MRLGVLEVTPGFQINSVPRYVRRFYISAFEEHDGEKAVRGSLLLSLGFAQTSKAIVIYVLLPRLGVLIS